MFVKHDLHAGAVCKWLLDGFCLLFVWHARSLTVSRRSQISAVITRVKKFNTIAMLVNNLRFIVFLQTLKAANILKASTLCVIQKSLNIC